MNTREGPSIRTIMRCHGCKHEHSESYQVQGDSGHDVYCLHPSLKKRHIGDTTWKTPIWCPILPSNIEIK